MDKRAKKNYEKAMDLHEKGKINKALELCEKILSEGLDNPDVLNFKGLLLYQKGNLSEAITVWRINKEINNDNIADNYIKVSVMDEKRLVLYKKAENALKQLKVDMALELFKECASSDFNCIKVNTGMALCYQKKGDFYRAKEYADKALSIDEDAVTAGAIEKELKNNGVYEGNRRSSKGILIVITVLFVILALNTGWYLIRSKLENQNSINNVEEVKQNSSESEGNTNSRNDQVATQENAPENSDTQSNKKVNEQSQNPSFDKEKLVTLIDNNDLDGIYEQVKNVKESSLSSENNELYQKAISLMKNQGVAKFYEYGLWYFNQGDYPKARSELDKAYTYCEGNSLKEHILFYRASNSAKLSDNNVALGQFEEYYNQYPDGTYIQETLYELTLLSDPIDKQKSKKYANILLKNYPNSIYANNNIQSIAIS